MHLDVVFAPRDLDPEIHTGRTAVVLDILRATSVIATALAHGASEVRPVQTVEQAFALAQKEDVLLCGERGGLPVQGFHLGNSPREFTSEAVRGRSLVMTTTNGTRAMESAHIGSMVFVGSLLNRRAVTDVLRANGEDVILLCAGLHDRFSLEDTVGAGAMVSLLPGERTDRAIAAQRLFEGYTDDLLEMLKASYAGQYLTSIGLGDDLPVCARLDALEVVPRVDEQGRILPFP